MQYDPGSERLRLDPTKLNKVIRRGRILLVLILVVIALFTCVGPYTDFLWYAHDARHPQVFEVGYGTRGLLLIVVLLVTWGVLYWNVRKAFKVSLIFLSSPQGSGQAMLSNAIDWITRRGALVVMLLSPVLAFLLSLGFSGEWNTMLLAQNPQSFGMKDPLYGIDLGFFVFTLPWYRAITNYVFGILLLTTLISVGVYAGLQAMAMLAKIELSRPHIRSHVSNLIGVTFLAFALQTWFKTYEFGFIDGAQFTGAGFSATYQLSFVRLLAILIAVVGVGTLVGGRVGKPYFAPSYGGVVIVLYYLLVVQGTTFIIQRFAVDTDPIKKEAPYARNAIEMTRYAYGLGQDKIATKDWAIEDTPTPAQVTASKASLDNMRLWDPNVLRQALEGLQSFKQFYAFNDVDIDRYMVNGKETMLMLAPRDLRLGGLPSQAQNWANQRLRYTHGYGLTISQVDKESPDGQPVLLASNMPVESIPDIPITEPRIYFSDQRDANDQPTDEYALVDTGQQEFDYPTAGTGSATHEWTGDRGVPISGLLSRLAFSILLGDGNLLISRNVTSDTRLLMRRNILERAAKIYPFLKFDEDPYIVVHNGRLVWIIDGYTSTEMIPYSEKTEGSLNYIRNSVKITVDAYSGESTAFAVLPDEPVLRAYRHIYPGLIRDISELPSGLKEHFRYPEDLFHIQALKLLNYHVTDPTVFLTNSDAWDIARERNLTGEKAPIRPYYVQLQLKGEPKPQFQLILPFTPTQKPNMSSWLTAQCDPGVYGQMTLYRFKGPLPKGPELMEADFSSTPAISYINRQYRNDQSDVIVGNLLVIPIGRSVMYSESLFLQSKTSGIQSVPRLFRVILALNNKVVVGETYADALKQLFESSPISPTVGTSPIENAAEGNPKVPGPTATAAPVESIKSALQMYDEANAALKNGDFAKYGQLQKQVRKVLEDLAKKQ